ncbi:peroxiredoxin [Saccharicrinis sp. FJH62]|uniref:peroxiredoxin n=1 Tax=Saccharicrinis sp. FJH62 TaxID=3344657 RepID=UPI0035D51186
MKKNLLLITVCFLLPLCLLAQKQKGIEYFPLIGEKAPEFKAESTQGNLNFPKDFGSSWKILLSHPADFTPVCTSELLEMAHASSDFDKLGVKIAVVSTDNIERHKLWVKSMEELTYKGISNTKFNFPLCSDPQYSISRKYGMIHPNVNSTKNVRGVFIIDPTNSIRAIMFYPMETGRNIEEIKRTVLALQKSDDDKVLTPANWTTGADVIIPFKNNSMEPDMSKKNSPELSNDPTAYAVSWYFMLKPDKFVSAKE